MSFNYRYETNWTATGKNISAINTLHKKIEFYLKEKTIITVRLKEHSNYFITGKILVSNYYDCIIEVKGKKVFLNYCDIDEETIIPEGINPIKEFVREVIDQEKRALIFDRDNNRCTLNLEGCTKRATEIDHIIPISKGGSSGIDNLQAACSNCNKRKNDKILV